MNALYKIKYEINDNTSTQELIDMLNTIIPDTVYSYIARKNNNIWKCQFTISTISKYNLITKESVFHKLLTTISNKIETKVFDQPSLDIMIELYTPFIKKLAYEQKQHWQHLEYDDLLQMCYLSLIKLYRKGYYLNNLLLKTTYIRDVLLSIRKNNTEYDIVSMDEAYGKDDSLSIKDTLEDTAYSQRQQNNEYYEEVQYIFDEVKAIIVDLIGERRFDQLYREYKTKSTTNAGTQTMTRIKRYIKSMNIDMNSFRK